jgi:hypothetical protein
LPAILIMARSRYNHWLRGPGGSPSCVSEAVRRWLHADGITRVVSGHWPHGDSPLFIKCHAGSAEETELLVCAADTSYSDRCAADKRGGAAAGIYLEGNCLASLDETHVRGRLTGSNDSLTFSFVVEEDDYVGKHFKNPDGTESEWWVRLPIEDSPRATDKSALETRYLVSTRDFDSPYSHFGEVCYDVMPVHEE